VAQLTATAHSLGADDNLGWHAPAHALVALARVDGARAGELLPAFVGHPDPFVRMYAARAAGPAGDLAALAILAGDTVANVRTEAVRQLAEVQGRGADALLVRTLASARDPQLVVTVAHLLAGAATVDGPVGTALRTEVADTALATLDRLSNTRRETLRDARLALLGLLKALTPAGPPGPSRASGASGASGGPPHATLVARLEPYLVDYDAAVADTAASLLRSWTGGAYTADPQPLPRLPLPTPEELRAMERVAVVLHMARGGSIEIRLLPLVAPTNALRLYLQARSGTLDGRTFHRVVPDFVIQGGSPDANEYSGNGAFTRDEVGLPVQWRGTVGLSTRGRDTGDGQLYVNLVDNVRLDHDYTVFGVVTAGMDVADAVLEGDVIRRAEVRPRG
jgi:cyclophilin family peptidyl-prolyl cis-trans isomerase